MKIFSIKEFLIKCILTINPSGVIAVFSSIIIFSIFIARLIGRTFLIFPLLMLIWMIVYLILKGSNKYPLDSIKTMVMNNISEKRILKKEDILQIALDKDREFVIKIKHSDKIIKVYYVMQLWPYKNTYEYDALNEEQARYLNGNYLIILLNNKAFVCNPIQKFELNWTNFPIDCEESK